MLKRFLPALTGFCLAAFAASGQELYRMPAAPLQSRVSSFENPDGIKSKGGMSNRTAKGNAFESLNAGETKDLLKTQEAGVIQRIWITVNDRSDSMLRALRLRMYWDGSGKPAVDVPLGDFFCVGAGKPVAFQSALFSNPEGRSFNCYIPMPFRSGARITLSNESHTDLPLLFYDIDFVTGVVPDASQLYFHAYWAQALHPALGKDVEFLPKIFGRGRFLGLSLGVIEDSAYTQTWWGEGEVKMYLDGDTKYPTINGTGAEDYIGTGWGEGTFNHLYQGCLQADGKTHQYSFYRFHVPDQIWFFHDFRAAIQQIGGGTAPVVAALQKKGVKLQPVSISGKKGFTRLLDEPGKANLDKYTTDDWVNFYRSDDYASTVYFYLDRPENGLPERSNGPVHQGIIKKVDR